MQKMFRTYLIMLTLGLFLLPNAMFARGTQTEKKCCSKSVSSETTPKKCCKDKSSQKEHKGGCEGKCGNSTCTAASVISVIAFLDASTSHTNSFDFSTEKQLFYDSKTFISAGFSSLWLIPKIG